MVIVMEMGMEVEMEMEAEVMAKAKEGGEDLSILVTEAEETWTTIAGLMVHVHMTLLIVKTQHQDIRPMQHLKIRKEEIRITATITIIDRLGAKDIGLK